MVILPVGQTPAQTPQPEHNPARTTLSQTLLASTEVRRGSDLAAATERAAG